MKLNLRTIAYLFFFLQITSWARTGIVLPTWGDMGSILYWVGYHTPMIIGIILLVVEIVRIRKK